MVRLKSSLFMILSRFKDVINRNIEASSENFIVILSVYSMPSLSFLNVSLVFLTALLLSSATFLLLKQLACHSQKFLDQLSNLSYMVQEPQRMHFTTILSLNFCFFLPILFGLAKARLKLSQRRSLNSLSTTTHPPTTTQTFRTLPGKVQS